MMTLTHTTSQTAPALRFEPLPALAAGALALGLLSYGGAQPLPVLGWAAAFLFLVVEQDLRCGRIPNALTLPSLFLSLGASAWLGGGPGLLAGLAGAGLAFALLFPLFAARVLGAGDVKAIMVLGALFGAATTLSLLAWMVGVGGAMAIAIVGLRGGLRDLLDRWSSAFVAFGATRKFAYLPPAPDSPAAGSMPFGVAITVSVIAHNFWGAPWA